MKRILLTLMAMMMVVCASAQSYKAQEMYHKDAMYFMGIPMKGKIKRFVKKLTEEKNMSLQYIDKRGAMLEGSFDCRKCDIFIKANDDKNVIAAMVIFDVQNNWGDLEKMFSELSTCLKEKYGFPKFFSESFEGVPITSAEKYDSVKKGLCKYSNTFKFEAGEVLLCISKSGAHVSLIYNTNESIEWVMSEGPHPDL